MQEHEQSVDSVHSRSAGTDQLMDGKTDEYEGSTSTAVEESYRRTAALQVRTTSSTQSTLRYEYSRSTLLARVQLY